MDVSIIFVNWNSLSYLRECIRSIYEHTKGLAFEIIVVDNASTKDDVDELPGEFPGVAVIKSKRNIGFAGANNLGFTRSSGSYVMFLNPDTLLIGPAIQTMLQTIRTLPAAGVLGCKLLNSDLSVQTSCIQKYPTILNQLTDIEYFRLRWPKFRLWEIDALFEARPQRPVEVEVISGAFMMMSREVFEKAGRFSEDYFMYAEDIDLCYKVARAGFSNYFAGQVTVIHHGGKSSSQYKAKQWATIMKFRAMTQFCCKTHGRIYSLAFRTAMGCAAAVRLTLVFVLGAFGSKLVDYRMAAAKWTAILKWAAGLDGALLETSKGSNS